MKLIENILKSDRIHQLRVRVSVSESPTNEDYIFHMPESTQAPTRRRSFHLKQLWEKLLFNDKVSLTVSCQRRNRIFVSKSFHVKTFTMTNIVILWDDAIALKYVRVYACSVQ